MPYLRSRYFCQENTFKTWTMGALFFLICKCKVHLSLFQKRKIPTNQSDLGYKTAELLWVYTFIWQKQVNLISD